MVFINFIAFFVSPLDMLANSSSPLCHQNLSSMSDLCFEMFCYITRPGSFIYTTYIFTNIMIHLPVSIFILHHGFKQYMVKRSLATAEAMSHSDCFTFHMVTMKLIGVVGSFLCCYGIFTVNLSAMSKGIFLTDITWYEELYFLVLTCVERYLAVIHPITYLILKKGKGLIIRNVCICSIWLLSFTQPVLFKVVEQTGKVFYFFNLFQLILALTVVSFCSLVVLCVLLRPGPGEQRHNKRRVDQPKERAFYKIVTILGLLVLRFSWNVQWEVLDTSQNPDCIMSTVSSWFDLPCSLVLPLQFLLRTKLNARSRKISSG